MPYHSYSNWELNCHVQAEYLYQNGTLLHEQKIDVVFRVGAADAFNLAKEFYPVFTQYDLVHLERYRMYLKLQIDGMTSKPFSAMTVVVERLPQQDICTFEHYQLQAILKFPTMGEIAPN